MAWEENPRICLHMQLIAILSRTGVALDGLVREISVIQSPVIKQKRIKKGRSTKTS